MELELLKTLEHKNIIQYKDFIQTASHINIVLEYAEGGCLSTVLKKFGTIPESLVIRYVWQILEGLEYLHSREVIHRDIKG